MRNLAGKVAFVTGGASGIGFGMVRAFLEEGMKVVIADYNPAHLDAARAALAGSNAVHFVTVDVSDRAQLKAAADEAIGVFGGIHVLCNNAGIATGSNADYPEFAEWDKALSVNLGGVVNGCKIIVPMIRAQGEGGHVVNTASMAGMVPLPGMSSYSTAKYAVRGLTESLRMQLAPDGIGVSCLYPGATKSALLDIPDDLEGAPDDMTLGLWKALKAAMEPIELGRRVVHCIKENRFHILTHREFLNEVKELHREIEDSFWDDEEISEARSVFEAMRRETARGLLHMDAKD
jgi:NAD(P)-dependent dehydrogenase (short-subunit alcohol dehydrogenase family)